MIFRNPKRPPAGGTANGIRPRRYDYWRTGYNEEQPGELAFWVAQAGEYHCKPGYFTGDFEHANRTQFFYHLTGDAAFYCVDHPTPVQMGDLLIIPPRTRFQYTTTNGAKHHWFALEGEWPQVLGKPYPQVLPLGIDREIETFLVELREILILHRPGYTLKALGTFFQLLARWKEIQTASTETESVYPESVRNAIIYLRENYAQGFDASKTAAAVGLSPSYLCALFEKWLGESPKRFHTRCRIDQAQRLLREQSLLVSEVAYHLGFTDAGHFSRVFKQVTGMPPGKYAKQL